MTSGLNLQIAKALANLQHFMFQCPAGSWAKYLTRRHSGKAWRRRLAAKEEEVSACDRP